MLFAAGLGKRMAPLTDHLPKPLIAVAGRPLIDHALALATDAGATPVVVNIHYLGGMIRDYLRAQPGVVFSDETGEILETGGGLKQALSLLKSDVVATLNSDAVWSGANPLTTLWDAWDAARMDALLSVIPRDRAAGHIGKGDFDMLPDGQLVRGTAWVYTGAQIVRADAVRSVPDRVFSMNRVWDQVAATGRLFGVGNAGRWCDVGQPSSIALAEAMLADSGVGG